MIRLYLFFAFFFLVISLKGQNVKVIIGADTGNDIDDMHAIVMAFKSGKIDALAFNSIPLESFRGLRLPNHARDVGNE
jgi:hypothetical protein